MVMMDTWYTPGEDISSAKSEVLNYSTWLHQPEMKKRPSQYSSFPGQILLDLQIIL